jgi:type I restriction enzyme R subunit
MTPEQKAGQKLDHQLQQAVWIIQSKSEMNIFAGLGVAVREFPLNTGFADYMLYVDGKAAGVVEAKPEGHSLTGVEIQSANQMYSPKRSPTIWRPLWSSLQLSQVS